MGCIINGGIPDVSTDPSDWNKVRDRNIRMKEYGPTIKQLQAVSCRKTRPITLPTPDHPALRALLEDEAK